MEGLLWQMYFHPLVSNTFSCRFSLLNVANLHIFPVGGCRFALPQVADLHIIFKLLIYTSSCWFTLPVADLHFQLLIYTSSCRFVAQISSTTPLHIPCSGDLLLFTYVCDTCPRCVVTGGPIGVQRVMIHVLEKWNCPQYFHFLVDCLLSGS